MHLPLTVQIFFGISGQIEPDVDRFLRTVDALRRLAPPSLTAVERSGRLLLLGSSVGACPPPPLQPPPPGKENGREEGSGKEE